mmetsp:Transcript_3349/g.9532  ORF Transcript_3349/g.9532 Transcript_3349/m.9532 type:complete len:232 (-) Transcript_3349:1341-2036(-)
MTRLGRFTIISAVSWMARLWIAANVRSLTLASSSFSAASVRISSTLPLSYSQRRILVLREAAARLRTAPMEWRRVCRTMSWMVLLFRKGWSRWMAKVTSCCNKAKFVASGVLFSGSHDKLRIARVVMDRDRRTSMVDCNDAPASSGLASRLTSELIKVGVHIIICMFSVLHARLATTQRHDNRACHGMASKGRMLIKLSTLPSSPGKWARLRVAAPTRAKCPRILAIFSSI